MYVFPNYYNSYLNMYLQLENGDADGNTGIFTTHI